MERVVMGEDESLEENAEISENESNLLSPDKQGNNEDGTQKKRTAGVVYLSYIPPSMNVQRVREFLSQHGEIGRIFLQPGKPGKRGKPSRYFTEGWVEFKSKKKAKQAASMLNGQQVGGKRRQAWYDSLWCIKYLHRFRWTHLNERLAYEKAVRSQRVRTEIAQAKREANYYTESVEKAKKKKKKKLEETEKDRVNVYRQKRLDEEMQAIQRQKKERNVDRTTLLKSVFSAGYESESD